MKVIRTASYLDKNAQRLPSGGYNLPPGVSLNDIDNQFGDDSIREDRKEVEWLVRSPEGGVERPVKIVFTYREYQDGVEIDIESIKDIYSGDDLEDLSIEDIDVLKEELAEHISEF